MLSAPTAMIMIRLLKKSGAEVKTILTESGKQFIIDNKTMYANLLTHEAIFLLSMKNYEPIKIKSKKPISVSSKTAAA